MPRGLEQDPLYSLCKKWSRFEKWSFTVYFLGKRPSLLHPNTAQRSFFPLQSYSKKILRKNPSKGTRKH